MRIEVDFPLVSTLDSSDADSLVKWWDTLGSSWVRVNLVTDALGHIHGATGTSADLTGGADRDVLGALRSLADCVIIGGETVRREPDAVPRGKPVIIVSKTAEVPIDVIHRARAGITILHAPDVSPPTGTTGIPITRLTGSAILKAARSLGFRRVVCEGGPRIARALLSAGLVTEWCQTISPKSGTLDATTIETPRGRLVSVAHDDDGFRYLRHDLNGAPQLSPSGRI